MTDVFFFRLSLWRIASRSEKRSMNLVATAWWKAARRQRQLIRDVRKIIARSHSLVVTKVLVHGNTTCKDT